MALRRWTRSSSWCEGESRARGGRDTLGVMMAAMRVNTWSGCYVCTGYSWESEAGLRVGSRCVVESVCQPPPDAGSTLQRRFSPQVLAI